MAKKKLQKSSWEDIKKVISKFDNNQLMELVQDLFKLSPDNKDFLFTRFSIGNDLLSNYKKIIEDSIIPYLEDDEMLDINKANEAVKRYTKAIDNSCGEAELRVFYVECGNKFTLKYGDIDEDFYNAMIEMYEDAVEIVLELPSKEREKYRVRLQKIMKSASGIGWGYYDDLCGAYYNAFEDD